MLLAAELLKSMHKRDVGFVGLAGSGKDAASVALTQFNWVRRGFADSLKAAALTFGWDAQKDRRGRKFLQDLGMCVREYNQNFWIEEADKIVRRYFAPVVWTDVRFKNEADYIKNKRKGILIRIVRPEVVSDGHISEVEQFEIKCDHEVINSGTLEQLHQNIFNIINSYE